MSPDASIDDTISDRLAKASVAFGRLTKRLWNDHGIRLERDEDRSVQGSCAADTIVWMRVLDTLSSAHC